MTLLEVLRILFGTIFVLFLPGLCWSFVFFSLDEIDWIERIALSFGLSVALVPLAVFWLSWLFAVRINTMNVSLTVVGLLVLAGALYLLKKEIISRREAASLSGE